MIRSSLFAFICLFQGIYAIAQLSPNDASGSGQTSFADSVRMPFSTKYVASGSSEFFWGKHYRKEWGTSVRFPVLDMKTFKGGLTPDKLGAVINLHHSELLLVMQEYVLRTVERSPPGP
jgi:hypothetical protein